MTDMTAVQSRQLAERDGSCEGDHQECTGSVTVWFATGPQAPVILQPNWNPRPPSRTGTQGEVIPVPPFPIPL